MIAHILKSPFRQKEIFYDALEYQEIPVDEVFQARYNYGPQEEQIIKKNIIINFFQTLLARLVQNFLYPGSTRPLDKQRLLKTKHELKAIGAKFLSLKTPDGDTLSGVHLKATDFQKSIKKYFYLYKDQPDGRLCSEKSLTLRDHFCVKNLRRFIFSFTQKEPNEEAKQFIEYLQGLKFTSISSNRSLPHLNKNVSVIDYLRSLFLSKNYGYVLPFYAIPKEIKKIKPFLSLDKEGVSSPTVIISGGNNSTYASYKALAPFFLARGLDVMMVDFRGHGESTGIPTSHKTKLDLETAYQYLSKEKKVKNEDILLYGHCLGAGSSTDLAARRQGVNIIVDRSFDNFKNVVKEEIDAYSIDELQKYLNELQKDELQKDELEKDELQKGLPEKLACIIERINKSSKGRLVLDKSCEKLKKIAFRAISWIVDYDNETNLRKIKGKIALIVDRKDDIISTQAYKNLIKSCQKKDLIITEIGHSPKWIKDSSSYENDFTCESINEFLIDANLYRKVL